MLSDGSKFKWKGSVGSVKDQSKWKGSVGSVKDQPKWNGSVGSVKNQQNIYRASEEPDLLTEALGNRNLTGTGEAYRKNRRKGLRKRFLSLTDGISNLFSPEKEEKESLSRKGSVENIPSRQQIPLIRFPSNETIIKSTDDLPSFRRHAASFSSFRPPINSFDHEGSFESLSNHRGKFPQLDRLKKAPPSPPPRRYSFWLTPNPQSTTGETSPLANAVLSSSYSNLPQHLRPPPLPPPMRLGPMVSPYLSSSRLFDSPFLSRASSVPANRSFMKSNSRVDSASIRTIYFFPRGKSEMEVNTRTLFSFRFLSSRKERDKSSSCCGSVREKTISIVLQKENGTFGFTIKGGRSPDGVYRPLLVTQVKPGGSADREGSLKAGDRLVTVDGRDLTGLSLTQAQIALQDVENFATLGIRYDIAIMDSVRLEGNPLLVEIERVSGSSLGLSLRLISRSNTLSYNKYNTQSNCHVIIESIRTASIAERCGALTVGDVVCAVDGLRLNQNTLKEANQILFGGKGKNVTLEIIPNKNNLKIGEFNTSLTSPVSTRRFSNNVYDTIKQNQTLRRRQARGGDGFSTGINTQLVRDENDGIRHTECFRITILSNGRSIGIEVSPSYNGKYPVVSSIDPGGVAEKSGVLSVGDRILGVNGRNIKGVSSHEFNQMVNNFESSVTLDIEVDVADSVIPSSGTYSIKLSKRNCCHGIKLSKRKRPNANHILEDIFLISSIVSGSAAHRSGALQVGDQIIAIDNTIVNSLSLEEAARLLDLENEVVVLRIQKDGLYLEDSQNVTYTVQLERDKGILGISATGSEDPFEPIVIGGIVPGSLADRTGALHIGDRIQSINSVSLRGKPLSEAVRLLQGNDGTVTLKILKPRIPTASWIDFQEAPSLSVDSAVESCESGAFEPLQNLPEECPLQEDSPREVFSSTCGSTVRRKTKTNTSSSSCDRRSWASVNSSDSGQSDGTDWDKMIADLNQISSTCGLRNKIGIHDSNGNVTHNCSETELNQDNGVSSFKVSKAGISSELYDEGTYSVTYAAAHHRPTSPLTSNLCKSISSKVFLLTLNKDPFYEDFGFSVSDGLYEKGVFVNRIRKGGPAHRSGLLKPFDRILQVNETQTDDFDCCLTVPLIAAAEDSLYLKVSRTDEATPALQLSQDFRINSWLGVKNEAINIDKDD